MDGKLYMGDGVASKDLKTNLSGGYLHTYIPPHE